MTFRIRQLATADYPFVISVIDRWWGGRPMADKRPRLFFEHFTDTSFAAERDGRLAGFLAGFISQSRPGEAYSLCRSRSGPAGQRARPPAV